MGKVFIEETTLTAIGDAIRNKTGGEDLINPGNFAYEITNLPTGGGEAPEPIVLRGSCGYACAGKIAGAYIDMYGDTITTESINDAGDMFKDTSLSYIPFEINFNTSQSSHNAASMFMGAEELLEPPIFNNFKPNTLNSMFYGCKKIRNFPENYGADWDFTYLNSMTAEYGGNHSDLFYSCNSLRKVPMDLLKNHNPRATYSYSIYKGTFTYCYCLDEVTDLPVHRAPKINNALSGTFKGCARLKRLTFALQEDGTPYSGLQWGKQILDLTTVGYTSSNNIFGIIGCNSGITEDKQVTDDETYQALKDDDDWFTFDVAYSRYNHDSAVETINSLPDTKAYVTGAGSSYINTIKFTGAAGSDTDGGAINTLTEEEIAVAAAKGWTVTLA